MNVGGRQAFIGIGANLADREKTVRHAVDRMRAIPGVTRLIVSNLYETDPVGVTDQPQFLNAVAAIETTLEPELLLSGLQRIEAESGRVRTVRWGPRTLDLDLLAYEGEVRTTADLQLPHPRMLERAFVVVPLREVIVVSPFDAPVWNSLREALSRHLSDESGVRRYAPDVPCVAEGPVDPLDPTVREFLRSLKRRGVQPGLERIAGFLADIGDPHRRLPVVHIAGTNGKGSTAAMIESILRAAGWKTGLYTSPHLVRLGERFQVNRVPLGNVALAPYVRELQPVAEKRAAELGAGAMPTYFEFMTAVAFVHFVRAACDIVVLEAGMGGRLDATNVVLPDVSVITSIGLDHADFLGATIPAIAAEKAGIIKPGRPVVIGPLSGEAERMVREVAAERQAPLVSVADVFGGDVSRYPGTALPGLYQRANAASAVLAVRQLGPQWRISDAVIAAGLQSVEWPGRWQSLRVGGRRVIVDASHNADGAAVLDAQLTRLRAESAAAVRVVVGVLGAGRARPLLEVICRHAEDLHLVVPRQGRACGFEELEALIPPSFRGGVTRTRVEDVFPGPDRCALPGPPGQAVVVTGSIYLAGEVLAQLDPARGPIESDLQDF